MSEEIIEHRGTTLVRRQRLEPGEATPWHRDPYDRVTTVISGESLVIEFRDGSAPLEVKVRPGTVDRESPTERVHRAVNRSGVPYEEVTVFFLDAPDAVPQPEDAG